MIHAQNDKVLAELPAGVTGSTATASLTVDTLGYDYASVMVMRASNSATTFASVLKVEEGDTTSSYSNVTALVAGGTGGFTLPAISEAGTASVSVVKLDIDTKAKKRYLKVSYTPAATANVSISARLSRAEVAPVSNAEVGVLTKVVG